MDQHAFLSGQAYIRLSAGGMSTVDYDGCGLPHDAADGSITSSNLAATWSGMDELRLATCTGRCRSTGHDTSCATMAVTSWTKSY